MSKNSEKQQKSFYYILGKIGDILLWPILVISLFSSFFMLVQKKQNKVTSFFGYSFVNVLSGSMVNEGFKIGDTVLTKRQNERNVNLGDIIAFYYSSDTKSPSALTLVVEFRDYKYPIDTSEDNINNTGVNIDEIPKINDKSAEYLKKAQENKAKVYFHRVVAIYIDSEGNLFFKTKGSNNGTADTYLTRGDLVVGKYVTTPIFVRRAVSFCASPLGMIILVCFPLSMLVLMQCLSLIDQISVISLEKKLISGELSYKDEEIKKSLKGNQIELYNKVYYYYITPDDQKEEVKQYLWGDILNMPVLNDKQRIELALLNNSLFKLQKSDLAYWNEWIENAKGSDKRKLVMYKNQLFKNKLLGENINKEIANKTPNEKDNLNKQNAEPKVIVDEKKSSSTQPENVAKQEFNDSGKNIEAQKQGLPKTKKQMPPKKK